MKYETPICEVIEMENVDIICTSGFSDADDGTGDTPIIGV